MRTASKRRAPPPDDPVMTAEQMRRQDATVQRLKEAVAAQERRARAWLQAALAIVPMQPATAPDPEAD